MSKIEEVTNYLKNREDSILAFNHKAHDLKGKYEGYKSLALYPGEYGDRDIVIIYKFHNKGNQVAFYHIGNHKYVYGKKKSRLKSKSWKYKKI